MHVSTSCDPGAIQNAIGAAATGDIVSVPAGTAIWTTGISISKGITVRGQGDDTVICDNTATSPYPVTISKNSNNDFVRLTNFTFDGTHIANAGYWGCVYLDDGLKNFRIDHCKFRNMLAAIWTQGSTEGLIDHCTIYMHPDGVAKTQGTPYAFAIEGAYYDLNKWKVNWERPLALGTSNAIYMEDNLIDMTTDYRSSPILACAWGGPRLVFRYNNSINGPMDAAELYGVANTMGTRGISSYEIYGNTFSFPPQGALYAFQIGGGTGVIYDNKFTGYLSYGTKFHLRHWRAGLSTRYDNGLWHMYYGGCDGTSPMDGNRQADATATGTHTGSDDSNVLVCSGKSWTPNQWVGYGLRNTSDPGSSTLIVSNTANTITTTQVLKFTSANGAVNGDVGKQVNVAGAGDIGTLRSFTYWYNENLRFWFVNSSSVLPSAGSVSITGGTGSGSYDSVAFLGGGSKNHWDNGDTFVITNGYPCIDQVGRGPWQTDEPLYAWNNTYNSAPLNISILDSSYTQYYQANRDYYDGVQRPGYTAYTHPHPLQFLGVTTDVSSPTAPGTVYDGASTGNDIAFAYSTTTLSANWTASTDNESGISGYQYAIGTTVGGTNVTGEWIANGSLSVTKTGLALTAGTTYYFSVKAINGQVLIGLATNSDGQYVAPDNTPPSVPGTVRDGTSTVADFSSTTSKTQLSANWTASTDNESGISGYQYAIGTAQGATNVTNGWIPNNTNTNVTKTGLSLTIGTTYYFSVEAVNGAGLLSAAANSNGQVVVSTAATDTTAPSTPVVRDGATQGSDIVSTISNTILSANWNAATDPESGITSYQYAIGTSAGGTQTTNWTTIGNVTAVTKSGLTLVAGTTYYFSVRAINGNSLTGSAGNSNGQFVKVIDIGDTTPPNNIPQVRDGTGADINSTYSTTQLSANWDASYDAESGLARYRYAIGTSPGATNTTNWTDNGQLTSVTKTGLTLTVNTTYYFAVKAENNIGLQSAVTNSDGQCMVNDISQIPPVISNVQAANMTASAVTISWTTDKQTTSQVEYGITAVYGSQTTQDSSLVQTHSVTITGLTAGQAYHYRVISKDSDGRIGTSADFTFTTLITTDIRVYPNPHNFKDSVPMKFTVKGTEGAEIKIYTMSGKPVRKLTIENGAIDATWDGTNEGGEKVARGIYIYKITADSGDTFTGKLAVTR